MSDDLFDKLPAGGGDYDSSAIEVLEGLEPVRRRPGMYIGGTDERALHHLAAEVLDNAMDEAVAGHATRIEVELGEGNRLSITDNGRGIPVDEHPKFPGKSSLEVILTMLHSGGKFSGKAYATSGGLHGVGVSVVNALSSNVRVKLARSKAYLFAGVEIRWKCAPSLAGDDVPAEAVFQFPGGLTDHLREQVADRECVTAEFFTGSQDFPANKGEMQGRVEW